MCKQLETSKKDWVYDLKAFLLWPFFLILIAPILGNQIFYHNSNQINSRHVWLLTLGFLFYIFLAILLYNY